MNTLWKKKNCIVLYSYECVRTTLITLEMWNAGNAGISCGAFQPLSIGAFLQFTPAEIPPVLQAMETFKSAIMPLQYIDFSYHTVHYADADLLKSAQNIYFCVSINCKMFSMYFLI